MGNTTRPPPQKVRGRNPPAPPRVPLSMFLPPLVLLANDDPLVAPIVTEDIPRFWQVFDEAKDAELEKRLEKEYVAPGTPAMRFFMLIKAGGPRGLAAEIRRNRKAYERSRPHTLRIQEAVPAIRAAFCAFKYLYPDAKFPPVTFCVGRFSAGGTSGPPGLMLGAEMPVNDPVKTHWIVAHELVHFNQRFKTRGLREATLAEGSADFLGELASGGMINEEQRKYGDAHEAALWAQWKATVAKDDKIADWIGTYSQRVPRMGDLGYYVGYRITKSYYDRAKDKRKAIREILERTDAERFIEESGYNP